MSLYRKSAVLAKLEVTYGTDPVPTGADNAILTSEVSVTPLAGNRVTRNIDSATLGNKGEIIASKYKTITFKVELAGSGTAGDAPAYGTLLRMCGFSETIDVGVDVEYAPVSESFESGTIYFYHDGSLHKLTGSYGTVSFTVDSQGLPVMSYTFTGIYNAVSAAALPATTLTGFVTPIPVTNTNTPTFTVHGYAATAQSFSFDIGNNVIHKDLIGDEFVKITDRNPTGSFSIEEPARGTQDFEAVVVAETKAAVQVIHGTTAGNIVQFDAPLVQLTDVQPNDNDGVLFITMPAIYTHSDTGDDEFVLTVK